LAGARKGSPLQNGVFYYLQKPYLNDIGRQRIDKPFTMNFIDAHVGGTLKLYHFPERKMTIFCHIPYGPL
ncbi:MAG TPA: hypothetical protein P5121_06815, partial [Caldilineaceae bacterium]|nr:hypothetical protein [Caldilineaceae bacterium]